MAVDYFDAKLALNQEATNVVPGAVAQVYAAEDTSFTTPLAITDLTGVPLTALIASPMGIYPPFKVVSGQQDVLAKSGPMVTPLTSREGSRGPAGNDGDPGVGLPDAAALPDGYVPIVASGEWSAAPGGTSGGGGSGSGTMLEVYWIEGTGWPVLPNTAPPGIKSRWFIGGPTPYTGATWAGVRDLYVLRESV